MRTSWTKLLAVLTLGSTTTLCACAMDDANSGDDTTSDLSKTADSVAQKVARLIAVNPGATQVGPNMVKLDEGVTAIVPSEQDLVINPRSASGRCRGGNLCLFQDSNFGGSILQISTCSTVNLANFNMDNGLPWNNQASSIDNPLPRTGQAQFFDNTNGTGFMLALAGGRFLRNLTQDTSATGGNANDKIGSVKPCVVPKSDGASVPLIAADAPIGQAR